MRLIRGLHNLRAEDRGAIVTIGSFDGLHLGHRVLIERTLQRAREARRPALLLTFEPLPREYLQAQNPPVRLTNFRERWRALEPSGLDALLVLRFDERLRNVSGTEFLHWLTEKLAVAELVVGHDFRFGRDGQMTVAGLRDAAVVHGFGLEVIEPVERAGARVSSSLARQALAARDLAAAARVLGRSYSLRGRVVRGAQLGRTLGFPTANIRLKRRKVALAGIFAVRVHGIAGGPLLGVASLGTRPTVGGVEPLLETFVFDFAGDLYGRELEIEFVAHLREESRFESVELMVTQMHLDVQQARDALSDRQFE